MNHEFIQENNVVDRYLMGKLDGEETRSFEEHILHCQLCLDELELRERLRLGMKQTAAEEIARLAALGKVGLLTWFSRLSRSRQASMIVGALCVALVLLLPSGVMYHRLGQVRQERDRIASRLDSDNTAGTEAGHLRHALDAARNELEDQRSRFEQLLSDQEAARRDLLSELQDARAAQINTPIFPLHVERGGGTGGPLQTVRIGPDTNWIVLSFELDQPAYETYRVVLHQRDGSVVWQGDGFRPNHLDSLALSLHKTSLAAGTYTAVVEGVSRDGRHTPVATIEFRVVYGQLGAESPAGR